MALHKFIEEIGENVLPQRCAARRGTAVSGPWESPFSNTHRTVEHECAQAIRRHVIERTGPVAPVDLIVLFNENDGVVTLAGTVLDEDARQLAVQVAGNIRGIERVDDRLTLACPEQWRWTATRPGAHAATSLPRG